MGGSLQRCFLCSPGRVHVAHVHSEAAAPDGSPGALPCPLPARRSLQGHCSPQQGSAGSQRRYRCIQLTSFVPADPSLCSNRRLPLLQSTPPPIAALATLKPHGPGYFPEIPAEGVDQVGEPMEEGRTESLEEIIAKVRGGGAVSRGVTWVWNALRTPSWQLQATAAQLTAERKKRGRKLPEDLILPDTISSFQQQASHPVRWVGWGGAGQGGCSGMMPCLLPRSGPAQRQCSRHPHPRHLSRLHQSPHWRE